jgi:hypothetical protein
VRGRHGVALYVGANAVLEVSSDCRTFDGEVVLFEIAQLLECGGTLDKYCAF